MFKKLALILVAVSILVPGYSQRTLKIKPGSKNPYVATVMDFGARGDGITDDTKAVQSAVDACAVKGIKLIFPAGTFMTGTIILQSNTNIELTSNAVWKGIGTLDAYIRQSPKLADGSQAGRTRGALIYAYDAENISISGQGMIYGNGESEGFDHITNSPNNPFGLWMIRCRDVRIDGIQMQNSAFWMQNYVECEHLRINGIRVFNHANLNNDGLDITDCHDVIISNCEIDSSDDALCPKSSSEKGVSDVVINNCILASHAHGFKLGTASRGGFRRITASNLVIRPSKAGKVIHPANVKGGESGIELLSSDGGVLEDITIQNVVMDGLETPICIKLGDRWANQKGDAALAVSGKPGVIRNILIRNVIARRSGPIPTSITGYPGHNVENITLSDMMIEVEGGLPEQDMTVPENSGGYPYNRIFGLKLPAYAFFVRHAKNIKFINVAVSTVKPDDRRAFIFEDATGVLDNVEIKNSGGKSRAPVLTDSAEAISLTGSSRLRLQVIQN